MITVPLRRLLPILLFAGAAGVAVRCARVPAPAVVTAKGEHLYRTQCAECHGSQGQGVEGKYAGSLSGDWPLPRLARYIEQNMPEDSPQPLSPDQAQAVAAYLYDAFYSRAAQAKLRPARRELSHLTNRQYAVAVADLLRELEGGEPVQGAITGTRGLAATYYGSAQRGRFDSGRVVQRGVDPGLDATFAPGTPAWARVGSAEFSAQWRGSFLAEETGEYEFIVRTPNTVRVWINTEPGNPAEATLDVNVSNPTHPDHRVTVRLLGGRRYPIAIDYWALPEKAGAPPPAIALRWRPPLGSEQPVPARVLSPETVRPTFVLATRFPADDSSHGYERGLAVSKAWDDATTRAAFEVSGHVARRLDRLAGTRPGDPERARKIEAFAVRLVTTAFRRPLSAEETQRYVGEIFQRAPETATAVRRVVLLALKSPPFLYGDLPPAGDSAPGRAARLALGLWDSLPDRALTEAAAAGRLDNRAEVAAQAERMLGDPRARAKLREFFHVWLQLRYVEDLRKDPARFPEFTPEIIDDLRTSLNLFLDDVAWGGAGDFRELLRADYLHANARLARFYGLDAAAVGEDFVRVPAPTGERAGVITHPYVLAALSYPKSSSPIHRGVFLTRSIVGRALRSPSVAVAFNDEEFAPGMSMREKVEKLTRGENCMGCHAIINPLGFSLEWYDATGRFRRSDGGRPIEAESSYVLEDERVVRLSGAREVAELAVTSEQSAEAFIEQLFHHVVKQPVLAYGPDTLPALRRSFVASGWNLRRLLVEIATLAALPPATLPASAPASFAASSVTPSHP
ncbi:MAG: DUF1592 domain-containing protein [Verrucomicrobia bacterium]|nr:DUF1592 domain-containing protein [Verrucomicrobiota bacterium]